MKLTLQAQLSAEGIWLGTCPELGLVTQGDKGMWSALQMAAEAVQIVLEADAARGLDPLSRPAFDDMSEVKEALGEHLYLYDATGNKVGELAPAEAIRLLLTTLAAESKR